MDVTIYSKDECPFCTNAVALLTEKGLSFTEYKLDRDFTRAEIKAKFPEAKTFPVILLDKTWIGGYNELVQILGKEKAA